MQLSFRGSIVPAVRPSAWKPLCFGWACCLSTAVPPLMVIASSYDSFCGLFFSELMLTLSSQYATRSFWRTWTFREQILPNFSLLMWTTASTCARSTPHVSSSLSLGPSGLQMTGTIHGWTQKLRRMLELRQKEMQTTFTCITKRKIALRYKHLTWKNKILLLFRAFKCYLKSTPSGKPTSQTPLNGVTSGFSLKAFSCKPNLGKFITIFLLTLKNIPLFPLTLRFHA